MNSMNIID
jgi:hypothetical protein